MHVYVDHDAESLTQDDCTHGSVQLVGTPLRHAGIVEICLNSSWGRVCRNGWDNKDAAVVCNQLGYGTEGKCLKIIYALLLTILVI